MNRYRVKLHLVRGITVVCFVFNRRLGQALVSDRGKYAASANLLAHYGHSGLELSDSWL